MMLWSVNVFGMQIYCPSFALYNKSTSSAFPLAMKELNILLTTVDWAVTSTLLHIL
jgi:hypothetical protein